MPLAFSHTGLFVTDLPRMAQFYQRVLGLTQTDQGWLPTADPARPAELIFLSANPDEHHQVVLVSGRPVEPIFNVVNQISFRADSLATLKARHQAVLAEAAQGNASDVIPATHGNALSVYFRDPEGNRLELFIDTPWYVSQPIRVVMDLSPDDATIMAWVEAHARSLPGFRPRAEWRAELAERMRRSVQAQAAQ